MNTQSDPQNELSRVLQKICEIAEKIADGDYIFRGEPKHYPKVSSSLYREYQYDIEMDNFEIEVVQKEILDEAKSTSIKQTSLKSSLNSFTTVVKPISLTLRPTCISRFASPATVRPVKTVGLFCKKETQ